MGEREELIADRDAHGRALESLTEASEANRKAGKTVEHAVSSGLAQAVADKFVDLSHKIDGQS